MIQDLDRVLGAYESGRLTRRETLAGLAAVVAAVAAAGPAAAAEEAQGSTFKAVALDHIALRVTDIERSRDFYVKHLGLEVTSESRQNCFMSCGPDNFVALFHADEAGMDHYCYRIPEYRVDEVVKKLESAGLDPRRRENRVYFSDPDGLTVQLSG